MSACVHHIVTFDTDDATDVAHGEVSRGRADVAFRVQKFDMSRSDLVAAREFFDRLIAAIDAEEKS